MSCQSQVPNGWRTLFFSDGRRRRTDNGGSTSEIVRVLGGPAIGDIRSRLVSTHTHTHTKRGRITIRDKRSAWPTTARANQGRSQSCCSTVCRPRATSWPSRQSGCSWWKGRIDCGTASPSNTRTQFAVTKKKGRKRGIIAFISFPASDHVAFLVNFNTQILIRASREFNFYNGSVGNFFFTGARLFFGSLEAAIFLFSGIARIPPKTEVIPIVKLTFEGNTIGAVLKNGTPGLWSWSC